MRFLKRFKRYKLPDVGISVDDVKDICIELEDAGFEVTFPDTGGEILLRINIKKNSGYFKYNEVKEVLLRLKDYLGEHWYNGMVILSQQLYDTTIYLFDSFDEEKLYIIDDRRVIDITHRDIKEIYIYYKL